MALDGMIIATVLKTVEWMCLGEMNIVLGLPVEGLEHDLSKLSQEVSIL